MDRILASNKQTMQEESVISQQEQTQFSLSDSKIMVSHHQTYLQIRSGVRSGDKESCEAEGGTYNCADWGCHCMDNGTGDWD